ncbi:MAG: chloride channel protein [Proteobacteria bacterium]|nr:chloride channel protein [Pseudomonadota bacterium]
MSQELGKLYARARGWWDAGRRRLLPVIFAGAAPLDLRFVGRTLLRAGLVGLAAGLVGAAFFGGLELVQRLLLEELAGYAPLRAHGEILAAAPSTPHAFRPWLLMMLPALGGLACGLLTRLAPEARGGGGDAMIDAFHRQGGMLRRRVIGVKLLASLCTLGTGGAGGREGPTMHIGAALGSWIGRLLHAAARERRVLLVAGVAAGIAAVFRTPLGAALLAVEVLYRDGFESDALVPAIFASVVGYSVVISIFGESTLFAHAPRFPLVLAHLPLYGVLALGVSLLAAAFAAALKRSRRLFAALPVPSWVRPGVGGVALGALCTPLIVVVGRHFGTGGQGLGLLGVGYGAVQVAISGASWLPSGWGAVELLFALALVKLLAAALTIGSGGSAGDFAPALTIGGLFGGAVGRAARLLFADPRLDPGAFALVGMGVCYGGIAHVPLSALVLVCELAGNYDLLVPLMLAQGIAFIALRRSTLYEAQAPTQHESPVYRDALLLDVLHGSHVKELMTRGRPFVSFEPRTGAAEMLQRVGEASWQDVFPVVDAGQRMVGLVSLDALRVLSGAPDDAPWAVAADIMQPPVYVHEDDDLRRATERLVSNGLREIPVVDRARTVIGFLDEAELAKSYLQAALRAEEDPDLALQSEISSVSLPMVDPRDLQR